MILGVMEKRADMETMLIYLQAVFYTRAARYQRDDIVISMVRKVRWLS